MTLLNTLSNFYTNPKILNTIYCAEQTEDAYTILHSSLTNKTLNLVCDWVYSQGYLDTYRYLIQNPNKTKKLIKSIVTRYIHRASKTKVIYSSQYKIQYISNYHTINIMRELLDTSRYALEQCRDNPSFKLPIKTQTALDALFVEVLNQYN